MGPLQRNLDAVELFRQSLRQMVDVRHPLVQLSELIDRLPKEIFVDLGYRKAIVPESVQNVPSKDARPTQSATEARHPPPQRHRADDWPHEKRRATAPQLAPRPIWRRHARSALRLPPQPPHDPEPVQDSLRTFSRHLAILRASTNHPRKRNLNYSGTTI